MSDPIGVLVIEDDKEVREYLRLVLQQSGYHPFLAADGQEGLDLFGQEPDIKLILLDWMMPGLDGLEVLEAITREEEYPPVVMLTAKGGRDAVSEALMAGAADYLIKPIDKEQLLLRVARYAGVDQRLPSKRMAKRKNVSFQARASFTILRLNEEQVELQSTFPIAADSIVFVQSDAMSQKLELPWDHRFAVRVASCEGAGNAYHLVCQMKGLTPDLRTRIQRLNQSDGWVL